MKLTNKQKRKLYAREQKSTQQKAKKLVATVATGMLLGNGLLGTTMTVLAESVESTTESPTEDLLDAETGSESSVTNVETEEKEETTDSAAEEVEAEGDSVEQPVLEEVSKSEGNELEKKIFGEDRTRNSATVDGTNYSWTVDSNGAAVVAVTGDMENAKLGVAIDLLLEEYLGSFITSLSIPALKTVEDERSLTSKLTNLTAISLPNVTAVGANAFLGANKLKSIEIEMSSGLSARGFQGLFGDSASTLESLSIGAMTFLEDGASVSSPGSLALFKNLKTVNLPKVETVGKYSFAGLTSLTTINLSSAITVDSTAFSSTGKLKTVDIGMVADTTAKTVYDLLSPSVATLESLTVRNMKIVEDGTSFENPGSLSLFKQLKTISLPEATTIGDYAFSRCSSLTSVSLPKVTTLGGASVFSGCSSLTSVSLPEATTIGTFAFSGCSSLTSVSLPKVTTLGASAFINCSSLTSVSLPEVTGFTNLQGGTLSFLFDNCSSLASVSMPKATIEANMGIFFRNCPKLKTVDIKVADDVSAYKVKDLLTASVATLESLTVRNMKIVEDGTSFENPGSLSLFKRLKTISLPEATTIGDYAFANSSSLSSVSMPKATTVGDRTFANCSSLSSVSLPEATTIGSTSFQGVTALKTVDIGMKADTAAKTVGDLLSPSAATLESLTVRNMKEVTGVQQTGSEFMKFSKLTELKLPGATTVGNWGLALMPSSTKLEIPNVTELGASALRGSAKVVVDSFEKVETIGSFAFQDATTITKLDLPKVKTINQNGFSNASNLGVVATSEDNFEVLEKHFTEFGAIGNQNTILGLAYGEGKEEVTLTVGESLTLEPKLNVVNSETANVDMTVEFDKEGTIVELPIESVVEEDAGEYNSTIKVSRNASEELSGFEADYKGTSFAVGVEAAVSNEPVTVKYVDSEGTEIAESDILEGEAGEAYETTAKEIEGYTLDETKLPENATGTFSDQAQTVTYVYEKIELAAYGEFKLGYWKNGEDGFVLEGRAGLEDTVIGNKEDVTKFVEFVDEEGEIISSIPASITNWYDKENYDGFQVYMKKEYMAELPSGDFKVQVRIEYKGTSYVTAINENLAARGIGSYVDKIENISAYLMGQNFVSFGKLNNQMTMSVEGVKEGLNKLFVYKNAENEQVMDGWMNVAFDFNQKHTKELVIEGPGGEADIRYTKEVATWDINKQYNMGVEESLAKSGFQAVVPARFGDAAFTSYIVVTDEEGTQIAKEELK